MGEDVNLHVTALAPWSLGMTSGWPWTTAPCLAALSSSLGWKLPEVEWPCCVSSKTRVLYMGEPKRSV